MASTQPTAQGKAKICVRCGADCTGKERFKDQFGRYTCGPCHRAGASAPRAAAPAAPATEDDPLPMSDFFDDAVANQPEPCPTCKNPLDPTAAVCLRCGYNRGTGGVMKTAVVKEKRAAAPPVGGRRADGATLSVARSQRTLLRLLLAGIVLCVTLSIMNASLQAAAQATDDAEVSVGLLVCSVGVLLAYLVVWVWSIIKVGTTARATGASIVVAVLASLLMLLPLINIIVLLIVSRRAIGYLRARGIHVGFLGVSKAELARI